MGHQTKWVIKRVKIKVRVYQIVLFEKDSGFLIFSFLNTALTFIPQNLLSGLFFNLLLKRVFKKSFTLKQRLKVFSQFWKYCAEFGLSKSFHKLSVESSHKCIQNSILIIGLRIPEKFKRTKSKFFYVPKKNRNDGNVMYKLSLICQNSDILY